MTGAGGPRPSLLDICLAPGIVRRSLIVAMIIGTLLNLINQGDAILAGGPIVVWKIVLTYVVPYCVATYGAVTTRLEMMKREARA